MPFCKGRSTWRKNFNCLVQTAVDYSTITVTRVTASQKGSLPILGQRLATVNNRPDGRLTPYPAPVDGCCAQMKVSQESDQQPGLPPGQPLMAKLPLLPLTWVLCSAQPSCISGPAHLCCVAGTLRQPSPALDSTSSRSKQIAPRMPPDYRCRCLRLPSSCCRQRVQLS